MRSVYYPIHNHFIIFISLLSIIASVAFATQVSANTVLPDFSQYTNVKAKKKAFFDYMRPLVTQANKDIQYQQKKLNKLAQRSLKSNDIIWLDKLARAYRVKATTPSKQIEQLLLKVGTIPSSLALAQAANESAWGTSRFARDANNLFGQWCFSKGCGLVPRSRPKGAKYEVQKFTAPLASVKAYMRNLNTHNAYTKLRDIRACLLNNNLPATGQALANGLVKYSAKKEAYIRTLQSMIRVNKLETKATNPISQNSNPCHKLSQTKT